MSTTVDTAACTEVGHHHCNAPDCRGCGTPAMACSWSQNPQHPDRGNCCAACDHGLARLARQSTPPKGPTHEQHT